MATKQTNPLGAAAPLSAPESWPCSSPVLSVQAVQALLDTAHTHQATPDEDGAPVLDDGTWGELLPLFEFYGLRLPQDADCAHALELCKDLAATYAPAVRLASEQRCEEVAHLCGKLTPLQQAYAIAAGTQDRALAQRLARGVFAGRSRSAFLV